MGADFCDDAGLDDFLDDVLADDRCPFETATSFKADHVTRSEMEQSGISI